MNNILKMVYRMTVALRESIGYLPKGNVSQLIIKKWNKDVLTNMKIIDVCPTYICISAIVEFCDFKMWAKCYQKLLPKSLIKVAIIIKQYATVTHITHHTVSMAVFIVIVFRN